jgi:hypothetical protein
VFLAIARKRSAAVSAAFHFIFAARAEGETP